MVTRIVRPWHDGDVLDVEAKGHAGERESVSRIALGALGDTTQRVTHYPDFNHSSGYRTEAEITAQAAMTRLLALKIGYLLRYSNEPAPGFKSTDNTTTASVVVTLRSSRPAGDMN